MQIRFEAFKVEELAEEGVEAEEGPSKGPSKPFLPSTKRKSSELGHSLVAFCKQVEASMLLLGVHHSHQAHELKSKSFVHNFCAYCLEHCHCDVRYAGPSVARFAQPSKVRCAGPSTCTWREGGVHDLLPSSSRRASSGSSVPLCTLDVRALAPACMYLVLGFHTSVEQYHTILGVPFAHASCCSSGCAPVLYRAVSGQQVKDFVGEPSTPNESFKSKHSVIDTIVTNYVRDL